MRTNVVRDAAPAGRKHSLPLAVPSPGFTDRRATLTALAEDLTSHGTEHASFTDIGLRADQIDLHVRNKPQPLVDRPSTRNPEVKFCSVATTSCA